jgi:translation elongation factor aEF-1 beta
MRVHRTIKRKKSMAKVLISIKILPSDVTTDLNLLKKKIEKELPKYASAYKFNEEPIAFGLTALIAHIIIPEDEPGGLNKLEQQLQKIDEISQMETLMVRRVQFI